jgi:hypothetical protein
MPPPDERLTFAPDVVFQVIDGEALLLKLRQEVVFSLNTTGARVGQLIAEGLPLSEICAALEREFDAPGPVVAAEVEALVDALHRKGLVIRAKGPSR